MSSEHQHKHLGDENSTAMYVSSFSRYRTMFLGLDTSFRCIELRFLSITISVWCFRLTDSSRSWWVCHDEIDFLCKNINHDQEHVLQETYKHNFEGCFQVFAASTRRNGRTDGRAHERMDERTSRWTSARTGGRAAGRTDCTRTDGWMGGCADGRTNYFSLSLEISQQQRQHQQYRQNQH